MKRLLLLISIIVPIFVISAGKVRAATFENLHELKDNYIITGIKDDLYIQADTKITIKDDVPGDLFVTGNTVIVDGNVAKNAYIAAKNINIRGDVNGSVYAVGVDVVINGNVKGDVYVAGVNVRISGDIGGDLNTAGARVKVEGKVGDDARIYALISNIENDIAGDLLVYSGLSSINGEIGGDLTSSGGKLNFESGKLGGKLLNFSNSNLNFSDEVELNKTDRESDLGDSEQSNNSENMQSEKKYRDTLKNVGSRLLLVIIESLGLFILGVFILKFAPVKVNSALWMMENPSQTARSFGIGFVIFPAIFIVGLLLLVSIVGIPLFLFLFGLFISVFVMCVPIVGLKLGKVLLALTSVPDKYYLSLFLGIFIIQILIALPYFGVLVSLIVLFLGFGSLIRMQYAKYNRAKALV